MRRALIANPASGRGAGRRRLPEVMAALERQGTPAILFPTDRPGHAEVLARQAACDGFEMVMAAGGDGTIHEVLNGLRGSSAILAPIPLGTGNDLCRTLGHGASWESSLEAIAVAATVAADVGELSTGGNSRLFHNVAGCGFDVAVAQRINTGLRRVRGTLAYILGVLGTFWTYRPLPMAITVDDENFEVEAMLCAVANAQSYGGAMRIAPEASIIDGLFDVVVVERCGKAEFLRAFPKVFAGRHLGHPKVSLRRGSRVRIDTQAPQMLLADGELVSATPAEFRILPAARRIVAPARFPGAVIGAEIPNREER